MSHTLTRRWDGATSTAYAPLSFPISPIRLRWIGIIGRAMDNEIKSQAEAGEEILNFDIPDDALEHIREVVL